MHLSSRQLFDSLAAHQSRHHQGLGSSDSSTLPYAHAPAANAVSDAAAQARLIAARLAASLGAGSSGGLSSGLPSVFASALPPPPSEDMSDPTDPIAKARAIAARLSGVLGKRRVEGDAPGGFAWGKGDSSKLQSKIRVPVVSAAAQRRCHPPPHPAPPTHPSRRRPGTTTMAS